MCLYFNHNSGLGVLLSVYQIIEFISRKSTYDCNRALPPPKSSFMLGDPCLCLTQIRKDVQGPEFPV